MKAPRSGPPYGHFTVVRASLHMRLRNAIRTRAPIDGLGVESGLRFSSSLYVAEVPIADNVDSPAPMQLRRHSGSPALRRPSIKRSASSYQPYSLCSA